MQPKVPLCFFWLYIPVVARLPPSTGDDNILLRKRTIFGVDHVSLEWCQQLTVNRGLIHSDEGLTLETLVFEPFTVANLPYRPCG